MATSGAARKAISSLLLPSATLGSSFVATKKQISFCEAANASSKISGHKESDDGSKDGRRKTNLKKRMTAIGRFSLNSESASNPSVPTFFVALSGSQDKNRSKTGMTVGEFESCWMKREMPMRHPRFHATIKHSGYFDYGDGKDNEKDEKDKDENESDKHAMETMHTQVYRRDLEKRIERRMMSPMDVSEKLWDVQISSGPLGSSGAIPAARVQQLLQDQHPDEKESVLLFRAHHCIADGVSLVAALGDLLDEAQELRDAIRFEIRKRRRNRHGADEKLGRLYKLYRSLKWLLSFFLGCLAALVRQGYFILTTPSNPFLRVLPSPPLAAGRSISWCHAAPLQEVNAIAKTLAGPKATINDVFVSCVSAAISKQLAQHRNRFLSPSTSDSTHTSTHNHVPHINVVIPVHLAGGVLPPGRGMGNYIGAFVARVPGEMMHHSSTPNTTTNHSTAITSASDRLQQVHSSLYKIKQTPAPILSYLMARLASVCLPQTWTATFFSKSNANAAAVISNVKGFPKKVHINGRTVQSSAGFLPLPPGIPIGLVVQSYDGVITLSLTAEKWAVPDADVFLGWVLEEYRRLHHEANSKRIGQTDMDGDNDAQMRNVKQN